MFLEMWEEWWSTVNNLCILINTIIHDMLQYDMLPGLGKEVLSVDGKWECGQKK